MSDSKPMKIEDQDRFVQSFWHGGPLGPYEWLSISSFLRHGFSYRLFSYSDTLAVPAGCELQDAAEILPADRLFVLSSGPGKGSVAAFSDVFRYKLLYEKGSWWVDTDMVCLADNLPCTEYVFGAQPGGKVACGIIRCPPRSNTMRRCYAEAAAIGDTDEWSKTGPDLLSRIVASESLGSCVQDSSVFYPYGWKVATRALDPLYTADLLAVSRTAMCVHFWNEIFRRKGVCKTERPPVGSFLGHLYDRYCAGPAISPDV